MSKVPVNVVLLAGTSLHILLETEVLFCFNYENESMKTLKI